MDPQRDSEYALLSRTKPRHPQPQAMGPSLLATGPAQAAGAFAMRRFTGEYAADGKEKRKAAREAAGNKCIRCGSPSVPGRILTKHHFTGDKSNDEWWN